MRAAEDEVTLRERDKCRLRYQEQCIVASLSMIRFSMRIKRQAYMKPEEGARPCRRASVFW